MKDGPLQFTLRRLQASIFSSRFWGVILTVALILGVTGPFGTFDRLPLLPRFGYWLALALATFTVGYAAIGLAQHYLLGGIGLRPVRTVLAGIAAGVPVTAVVVVLNHLLFGDAIRATGDLLTLFINCSLIAAAISFLFDLVDRSQPNGLEIADETENPAAAENKSSIDPGSPPAHPHFIAQPPLLDRLPPKARGKLLYLSMQDHYVDVHTDMGSALVLMRLADAIGETGDTAGLQIHRSHWVALDAVDSTARRDGRLFLKMLDGALLPVSRSAVNAVKQAGIG